ncbi:MAG: MFS transporter [Bryobacteraceae bacterium]
MAQPHPVTVRPSPAPVSPARIFWAAWLGWMLDGFDATSYIYILAPAVSELLIKDGKAATTANVALYGGSFFTIFMLGWACSMVWGHFADRIGRVRVMCLTILTYSIFTGACGLAPNLLLFGIFRFLAGFGIGGEWAAGVSLLHESLPEDRRVRYAGWLHTATPIGITLGAAGSLLYPWLGWRGLFLVGSLPALLVFYLRRNIPEPAAWLNRRHTAKPSARELFRKPLARGTWCAALMVACGIFGLWSTSYWAPTFVSTRIVSEGGTAAQGQRLASIAGLITSMGILVACLLAPWIARKFRSRRWTGAFFFAGSLVTAVVTYGYAARIEAGLTLFLVLLPLAGFFTNGVFALYSMWLPEMFPGVHRAFGSAFAFSLGRLLGAVGPAVVGKLVGVFGSYPSAIVAAAMIYLIGIPFTFLSPETANKPLAE